MTQQITVALNFLYQRIYLHSIKPSYVIITTVIRFAWQLIRTVQVDMYQVTYLRNRITWEGWGEGGLRDFVT